MNIAAAMARLQPGTTIADFELVTGLGGRERSKVFLARQRSLQRLVAVRVEPESDPEREPMAQLEHPYIVRVFDERLDVAAAGLPVRLVYMEYLPGGTAADVLRRRTMESGGGGQLLRSVDATMSARGEIRPTDSRVRAEIATLSWPETVAWVGRRLAAALDHAHRAGIRHGAVTPSNVLFTAEGVPKLADFAIGPHTGNAKHAVAHPDSLPYQAPEQLCGYRDGQPGEPVEPDVRSDIYGLGVLLWELLCGARPFPDPPAAPRTPQEALAGRDAGVDQRLGVLPSDTPATLRRVLVQCLQPDPDQRWQSAADLAGQLELCLDARARDLVDPPPHSWRYRTRRALLPIAAVCVGLPNVLASLYDVRLNRSLIVNGLSVVDQRRFATVSLVNNVVTFVVATLLILVLCWKAFAASWRLGGAGGFLGHAWGLRRRGRIDPDVRKARAQALSIGDQLIWVSFGMWLVAGITWPMALMATGARLSGHDVANFYGTQAVCAAIALAYPFFPVTVFTVRSVYPQLLTRGPVSVTDGRRLRQLARRSTIYLVVAAAVPLLAAASATFVPADKMGLVITPLRVSSVAGILAFVATYGLFRLLEADVRALARALGQAPR